MATLEELQIDLQRVNTAIAQLISGERIAEFRIGNGAGLRVYRYSEVTLPMLKLERDRLVTELAALQDDEPTFRKSSRMQSTYSKF